MGFLSVPRALGLCQIKLFSFSKRQSGPPDQKSLQEDDMTNAIEPSKIPGKCPAPEGTWFQITFTLEPRHFRALWALADENHQTIPDLVRENVIHYLEEEKRALRKQKTSAKQNLQELL